jgi:hypothetical protein
MKIAGRLAILILLAALVILPLQVVQAKGLPGGPIFGENYTLKSGETLNEDLVVFGGSVSIEKDAKVNGAVVLFGGSFTLEGEVSKDVVVMGGAVKLGADSHIRGNLVTLGAPVDRDASAKVDGDVINNPTRPSLPAVPSAPSAPSAPTAPVAPNIPGIVNNFANPFMDALGIFVKSIALALLAMLIALFLPIQMRRVSDGVLAQPVVSFGMGLLTLIMFIVVVVALGLFSVFIITLFVTVPLIFVVSALFTAGIVLGWLALGTEVGIRIAQMFKGEWPLPLAAGLGVFLLNLVASIPCLGGLISGLVGLAGLGAVFMTRFGTRLAALTTAPAAVEVNPPAQN